jgi:hypothetical protein
MVKRLSNSSQTIVLNIAEQLLTGCKDRQLASSWQAIVRTLGTGPSPSFPNA